MQFGRALAWTVIWERVWLALSLTTEIINVPDVDRGLDKLLADTTYQSRSHKCSPVKELKAFSGFVSNWNNSMMRCRLWCVLSVLVHYSGLAWNSRLSGIQISKLNRRSGPGEGQPDNRKLNEPSAMRQVQFNSARQKRPQRFNICIGLSNDDDQ